MGLANLATLKQAVLVDKVGKEHKDNSETSTKQTSRINLHTLCRLINLLFKQSTKRGISWFLSLCSK